MGAIGRFNWNDAMAGKKIYTKSDTGGFIAQHKTPIGDVQRVIIPTVLDPITKTPKPIIFSEPKHRLERAGYMQIPTANGKLFKPFEFRCNHPWYQTDSKYALEIAERKEFCPLCEEVRLRQKEYWTEREAHFGGKEGYSEATKEEQTAFNNSMNAKKIFKESNRKDGHGEEATYITDYKQAILIIVVESKTDSKTNDLGETELFSTALMDGNKPKYTLQLMNFSKARQEKFNLAVRTGFKQGDVTKDMLHPISEIGPDGKETPVNTTFMDFELFFPEIMVGAKPSAMKAAAEMTVTAVDGNRSVVSQELIDDIHAKSDEIIKKAEQAFIYNNKAMGKFTNEEIISYMEDKGAALDELRAKYQTQDDLDFQNKIFEDILDRNNKTSTKTTPKVVDEEVEVVNTKATSTAIVENDVVVDAAEIENLLGELDI